MRTGLLLVLLAGSTSQAWGQELAGFDVGSRIRVRPTGQLGPWSDGIVRALRGDTILLQRPQDLNPLVISRGAVEVFAFRGRHAEPGRGLAIGLAVGVLGGAVLGYAAGEDCSSSYWICFDRGTTAAGGAILLGGIGAITGLIAGSLTQREIWTPIGGASLQPYAGTSGGRLEFGGRMRF